MPLYMDLHKGLQGVTKEEVEHLHTLDVQCQDKYDVKFQKFYINEKEGTVFCLVEAPNMEAAKACHQEAHGNMPCEMVEVLPSDYTSYMGLGGVKPSGMVVHPDGKIDSAVRSFLFTDIVGSTELTEKYGDIVAMSVVRKHNEIVRNSLRKNNGNEIKHTGDGIMASFISTVKAVNSALEIQKALSEYREKHPETPLHVRIGVNAGEPVTERDDFFGAAVQLSKRICDAAGSDQVLISEVVKELCLGRNFKFTDLGKQNFKGLTMPVKIFSVDK